MIGMDSKINDRWKRAVIDRVQKGFYSIDKGDDEMKLTNDDKILLRKWGFDDSDIRQISEAMQVRYTTYKLGVNPIPRAKAIELLGRREFLSGIARSAFHWTAARSTESGEIVYFDSSKYFRS